MLNIENCTGCGVCSSICPQNCINIINNKDGFYYPSIEKSKCIGCNLCNKVCPINLSKDNKNKINPKVYAAWNKNIKNIKESTSGGIFYVLAEYIIENKGIVFASKMNSRLDVYHTKIEKIENIKKVTGSKYIQSRIEKDLYKEIEKYIKEKREVLFCGTPCQVAAVKSFFKIKNINDKKLYTIDLVCHGVGSNKFFKKYIKEKEKKFKTKIIKYIARDKKNGWNKLTVKIVCKNGKFVYIKSIKDVFMKAYYSALIYRESCYKCCYSKIPRMGDITLGDYFEISKEVKTKEKLKNGISLVLLNNSKGKTLFEKCGSKITKIERNLSEPISSNTCLVKPMEKNKNRDILFKNLESLSMKKIDKLYCQYSFKTKISFLIGPLLTEMIQKITHKNK